MATVTNRYQPDNVQTYGVAPLDLCFYLNTPGGTGALTFGGGCPSGLFVSATHAATGKYTVTLNIATTAVIFADAAVDDIASPDFSSATVGPFSNEGTTSQLSFTLNTVTSGSATDLAASRKVRIRLRLQMSSWGKMT